MRDRFIRQLGSADPFRSIYNGGGKPDDPPDAPNYEALAKEQAKMQSKLLRQQTQANRINQYTPWGSLTYSHGGNFDQAGYDAAMKQYNKELQRYNQQVSQSSSGMPAYRQGGSLQPTNIGTSYSASSASGLTAPKAPSKSQFGYRPDQWSSTMQLAPELQQLLENQWGAQGQGYDELQNYLANIQDPNRINAAPINPGQTAQDAIMARLQPSFADRDEEIRNRLYNQGVRPGTEAWDKEMANFERTRNDAFSQAALQGIDLDFRARQNALAEQGMPLNAINTFLSGGQVNPPQFQQAGQAGVAQSPDLLGAAQAQYGSALNSYNASQASQGNMLGGLFSLGGAALGGFGGLGGALGAATGGNVAGGINLAGSNPFKVFGF
jgi:hypothetical protein